MDEKNSTLLTSLHVYKALVTTSKNHLNFFFLWYWTCIWRVSNGYHRKINDGWFLCHFIPWMRALQKFGTPWGLTSGSLIFVKHPSRVFTLSRGFTLPHKERLLEVSFTNYNCFIVWANVLKRLPSECISIARYFKTMMVYFSAHGNTFSPHFSIKNICPIDTILLSSHWSHLFFFLQTNYHCPNFLTLLWLMK